MAFPQHEGVRRDPEDSARTARRQLVTAVRALRRPPPAQGRMGESLMEGPGDLLPRDLARPAPWSRVGPGA